MLVVNPWHWLTKDGSIPEEHPEIRRNLLRVARVIELGAEVPRGHFRDTLIECRRRPGRKACTGLLDVAKLEYDTLLAYCPQCGQEEMWVHAWQGTEWAEGLAPPLPLPSRLRLDGGSGGTGRAGS
jgi:hypothetical protein